MAALPVTLTVLEARNLPAADKGGTSDPFAKITVNKKTSFKTKTIKKTLNPIWSESFTFTLAGDKSFEVEVYDWDAVGRNDKLGNTTVPLEGFPHNIDHKKWYPLTLKGKPSGEIHIAINIRNDAAPPPVEPVQPSFVAEALAPLVAAPPPPQSFFPEFDRLASLQSLAVVQSIESAEIIALGSLEGCNSYSLLDGDAYAKKAKVRLYNAQEVSSNVTRAGAVVTDPSGKTSVVRRGSFHVEFRDATNPKSKEWFFKGVTQADMLGNLLWHLELNRPTPAGMTPQPFVVGMIIHNEEAGTITLRNERYEDVMICTYDKKSPKEFVFKSTNPGLAETGSAKILQAGKSFFGSADTFKTTYAPWNTPLEKGLLGLCTVAIDFMFFEKVKVTAQGTAAEETSQLSSRK